MSLWEEEKKGKRNGPVPGVVRRRLEVEKVSSGDVLNFAKQILTSEQLHEFPLPAEEEKKMAGRRS